MNQLPVPARPPPPQLARASSFDWDYYGGAHWPNDEDHIEIREDALPIAPLPRTTVARDADDIRWPQQQRVAAAPVAVAVSEAGPSSTRSSADPNPASILDAAVQKVLEVIPDVQVGHVYALVER